MPLTSKKATRPFKQIYPSTLRSFIDPKINSLLISDENEVSKQTIYKQLKLTDKLSVAFPKGLPANSRIDKGKCDMGMTYGEMAAHRHTLLVIPYCSIINDKFDEHLHRQPFKVDGDANPKELEQYLQRGDIQYKKILCTPESFGKVIRAAIEIGRWEWLRDEFFLLMDEAHAYVTDAFREDILNPFKWFWSFKSKCIASATLYNFTDPRFEKLQHYKITFEEKFGEINIVHVGNVAKALNYFLANGEMFPGNLHFFFNSVTESGNAARNAKLTEVNIFCRDEEKNMDSLDDMKIYFKDRPLKGEYKKFNFYSQRYNEGWDMYDDDNATIVLVSDIYIPHSLISIPYKGFQAIGRLRKVKPHKIYHITNNLGVDGMKTEEQIKEAWQYNATHHIKYYNDFHGQCVSGGQQDLGIIKKPLAQFANFNEAVAELDHMKLDQLICRDTCREHFNNRESIEDTWEACNYNTKRVYLDLPELTRVYKSKAQRSREIVALIKEFEANKERYIYGHAVKTLARYKEEFDIVFEAYYILGEDEMEKLDYNEKAMREALVNKSNQNAEAKLRVHLSQIFQVNKRYTNAEIKQLLQAAYNKFDIRTSSGAIKRATAKQLAEFNMFQLKDCKKNVNGKLDNGVEILKQLFELKSAA